VTNTSNVRRSLHFIVPPAPSTVNNNNNSMLTASFSSVPPSTTSTSLTSFPVAPGTSDGKETKAPSTSSGSSLQLPAGATPASATSTAVIPSSPPPPAYDESFVSVSPQVVVLEAGQTSRVQFRFSPLLTLPTALPTSSPVVPIAEVKDVPLDVSDTKQTARVTLRNIPLCIFTVLFALMLYDNDMI
jgi:hypothetical protein